MNHHSTTPPLHHSTPLVWTIAGSDPGGGAGIQADLKTFHGLGVYGCAAITALTVQNTLGVRRIKPVGPGLVGEQVAALAADLPPAAVKIGMLPGAGAVRRLAAALKRLTTFVVADPIVAATSGADVMDRAALDMFIDRLLPRVDLLTPNLPEVEALLGSPVRSDLEVEEAAAELVRRGARSVLVKGGHRDSPISRDYWTDGRVRFWITSRRRQVNHTHGTGCTLSAALTAFRALGHTVPDALVLARAYVNQGLRLGGGIGAGRGPLFHGGWPDHPQDLPWIEDHPTDREPESFPAPDPLPLGLYPIVDRASQVERLLDLGADMVQLRVKDLTGAERDRELERAAGLARGRACRLFINDAWQTAVRLGCYGVHLGQDDLPSADLDAIRRAGLRLGVSTHSHFELARAWSVRPSYIALGTVFHTATKKMDYPPLGLEAFRRMRRLCPVPVVAIGGIHLEAARDVVNAGADGVAVISEIRDAPDPGERLRAWAQAFRRETSTSLL